MVNKLDGRLDSVDKTLLKQEENLRLHMYRTELAEKRIEHIEADMTPVKEHVASVSTVFKFVGWLLGSGAVIALIELYVRR